MKVYHSKKLKLATLVAKNDSKRLTNQLVWVLSGYQKRVFTQKDIGDPVIFVGCNYELPVYNIDILDCYYKGRKQKW